MNYCGLENSLQIESAWRFGKEKKLFFRKSYFRHFVPFMFTL